MGGEATSATSGVRGRVRSTGREHERAGPRRRAWTSPAVLGLYTILALLLLREALFSASPRWVGLDMDPPTFMWYLRWVPFAVRHGINPLFTDYLAYPHGANLMSNASIVAPSLLMAPVTALAGPLVAYNVLSTAAIVLSAWCAFLVLRRYTPSVLAATLGAAVYGFGPFEIAQARGHLNLSIALFPPLLLLIADEALVRQRRSRIRLGVALGLLVSVQLLTGSELLVTGTMAAAIGTVLLMVGYPRLVRARAPYALAVLGVAAAVAIPLCAYPLWMQFLGPQHVGGRLHPNDLYVADLVAFVRPGQTAEIGLPSRFPSLDSEAFVGAPLLTVALLSVVALGRRRPAVLVAALLAAVVAVLSMGPRLHVDGTSTGVHLPWRLVGGLPVLENIIPIRLMVHAYLLLGLIVAITVGQLLAARRRWVGALGPPVVAAALVPLLPSFHFPTAPADTPTYFTSAAVERIPPGSTALVTPVLDLRPMLWQAEANMRFRMPEGGVYSPGPMYNTPPSDLRTVLFQLQHGQRPAPDSIPAADRADYVRTLHEARVQTVIVGPQGQAPLVRFFTVLLGRPPDATTGGVAVWRMPAPL